MSRAHRWDVKLSPYLYVAPYFLIFGVFVLFPLLYTGWVSLHERTLLEEGGGTWAGLDNYARLLFEDPYFWNAMGNTLSLWLLTTVPQIVLALAIANLLNHRIRSRTLFRMGVLLPNVTSVAAVTLIFAQLFGRDFGLVNWVLGIFGAGEIDWQAGTASSHVAIAVMVVWRWTGYHALIFLAGMQAIPRSVYEAATIDGAGAWQQFRSITLPMLRPVLIFSTIIYGLLLLVPISIGIAILRSGLWDIDVIIRRTLIYSVLMALLALIYVGSILILQTLLRPLIGTEMQLVTVASTLAIAALFQPLRRRVQRAIDRRFYRRKYDAQKTLVAFSSRLREETDLDRLVGDVVDVVEVNLQPAHVSLWLSEPEGRL
jgi:cellobiose transport system permease protein